MKGKTPQSNILTTTLRQTIQRKNWGWIGGLSGFSSIVGLVIAVSLENNIKTIAIWVIIILALCFILYYIKYLIPNIFKWIHNAYVDSIWGKAIVDLADAYASVHSLDRKDIITDDDLAEVLGNFCDTIKLIFDRKTHANCCVSIKVPISKYTDSNEWKSMNVKNIAIDKEHLSRITVNYLAIDHDIIGNTAYSHILSLVLKNSSKAKVYLNNDVKNCTNYNSTSTACADRPDIPYASELVVPIIPSKYASLADIQFGGFLCIDSDKADVFDEKLYDIPMTQGIADGLYTLMLNYLNYENPIEDMNEDGNN